MPRLTRARGLPNRILNQWLTAVSRPLNVWNFLRVALGEPNPFFPKIPSPVVDADATRASVRSSRIIPKKVKYFQTIPFSAPDHGERPAPPR
jgi:hypothetical protein